MTGLPDGPLVAWYGDDFTGAAATMEAMTFAGLPSAVFLHPPDAALLARFPKLRGIGIAGTARSETPDEMEQSLPALLRGLAATGAPLLQYKICSTLDSSPRIGSIGKAMELAQAVLGIQFFPILPAAPPMGRWQAFGTLFARAPSGIFRLDRHPVMGRHPVTPMDEADVARHLAQQTKLPLACLTLNDLRGAAPGAELQRLLDQGAVGVTLDAVTESDLAVVGRMIWKERGPKTLCVASQGLQFALIAHWREAGLLPEAPLIGSAGLAGPIAVISGSVSLVTRAQIDHAEAAGFAVIALDGRHLVGSPNAAQSEALEHGLRLLKDGRDVLFCTARGPDDPAVVHFNDWAADQVGGLPKANAALGGALGGLLYALVAKGGLRRAVISGGDTSGHAVRRLGIQALTAIAPTIPGAALCLAHSDDPMIDGLQLALKGGQMGSEDYFSWIRAGGGERSLS